MTLSQKQVRLLAWGSSLILILLLAATLPTLTFGAGDPSLLTALMDSFRGSAGQSFVWLPFRTLLDIGAVIAVILAIGLMILWLLVFFLRPEARRYLIKRLITYVIMFAVIYVLFSFLRFQIVTTSESNDAAGQPLTEEIAPPEIPPPPGFVSNPPTWVVTAFSLIIITLILGSLVWFWQRQQQHQPTYTLEPDNSLQLLALEAQQALDALHHGDDLRQTVLGCYRRMTETLQTQRGIHRRNTMTAREFEQHLSRLGVEDTDIRRLTRLFEQVRYGASEATPAQNQEAVTCLQAIVRAYGGNA